jgi:hypothetical protein
MVSLKFLIALPFALQALASPMAASSSPLVKEGEYLITRVCVPPSNCGGPVGACEFCCGTVRPNSNTCHSHGGKCADGSTKWHCDDASR